MSTPAEIEAAIEHLPAPEVDELAAWLARRRSRVVAQTPADEWLETARGAALPGMTTDTIKALTRGEP